MGQIQFYDTTLRDGAQQEGISFSVADKLKITQELDLLGIHYIEGGWPGANPKDTQFFIKAQNLTLANAKLTSFGSTRRPHTKAEDDANLRTLVDVGTQVVAVVGKSWDLQVTRVLETTQDENLKMITDSIRFLKLHGLSVFFDAEHFFDGYKSDRSYTLSTLEKAAKAGAEVLVLCDTNGGALPHEVSKAVEATRKKLPDVILGIHAHNDSDLAVANSLAAVQAGVTHVQGTINGYGERCGNANLCSIIPALQLKMGIEVLHPDKMARLTEASRYVSELANLSPDTHQPYTGASAFTHKAGMHASGVAKWEESYQHVDPKVIGNRSGVLVSELSGASNILYKARERDLNVALEGERARQIVEQIKSLESRGFQYEGAEASFELIVLRTQPDYERPFELVDFLVLVETRRRTPTIDLPPGMEGSATVSPEDMLSEAAVKVKIEDKVIHTVAEGNGPVNALDAALRKALMEFYPTIAQVELVDYKVRILEESAGTESQVRVLIESGDGRERWRTVGSSTNIIEASWLALADSLEYWLVRRYRDALSKADEPGAEQSHKTTDASS
jgi:2-isopropylmalate synthase